MPTEFLGDVHRGIWSELYDNRVQIGAYRRNLQDVRAGIRSALSY